MTNDRDYIVAINATSRAGADQGDAESNGLAEAAASWHARPWIGILFECCGVYARVYRDPEVHCYQGRCPRCGGVLHVSVGPEGVTGRVFRAR